MHTLRNEVHVTGTVQVLEAIGKILREGATRKHRPLAHTTGIRYKQYDPAGFPEEQQLHLADLCDSQEWASVCDARFKKYGRGVVALHKIKKDDVIMDYHGVEVHGVTVAEHCEANPSALPEFCVEIAQNPRRVIDGTAEKCPQHKGNRCLGRLANHAEKGAANMVMYDISLTMSDRARVVALVARVDIEPFQQLFWDYKDVRARKMFRPQE